MVEQQPRNYHISNISLYVLLGFCIPLHLLWLAATTANYHWKVSVSVLKAKKARSPYMLTYYQSIPITAKNQIFRRCAWMWSYDAMMIVRATIFTHITRKTLPPSVWWTKNVLFILCTPPDQMADVPFFLVGWPWRMTYCRKKLLPCLLCFFRLCMPSL